MVADNVFKAIKGKIKFREPMRRHTTFKIGGPAKYYLEPRDIRQLKLLLKAAKRYKIPVLVIGAGSNILAADQGLEAAVLRLAATVFKKISGRNNNLTVASGVTLSRLLSLCRQRGLAGLEFLAGIPGTLGGALAMNAGIPQKNIADLVEDVRVMDYNGKITTLKKKEIKFGYRSSGLAKYIILNARLRLTKADKRQVKERIENYLRLRRAAQDNRRPSAGCVFKNHQGLSAGRLIDLCGLKGKRIGGASICGRHANFILNLGAARARDVLRLMDLARAEVKKKFNITLEPEINIWQ